MEALRSWVCVRLGQRPRGECRRRGQGNMRVGQRRRQGKKQAEEFVTRPLAYLWTPLPSAQLRL